MKFWIIKNTGDVSASGEGNAKREGLNSVIGDHAALLLGRRGKDSAATLVNRSEVMP